MKKYKLSKSLTKIAKKLKRKDRRKFNILMKKIEEIINSESIEHYKNLRAPMQHLKRVHINSRFVLVFEYDKQNNTIFFREFNHHDNIYK